MPIDEKMSVNERRKYLKLVAPRYARARRTEQSELLTEMGEVTGLHRKTLVRLMGRPSLERAPNRSSCSGCSESGLGEPGLRVCRAADHVAPIDYTRDLSFPGAGEPA